MKKKIVIFLLLKASMSIAQSKKEQIETLKLRIDSLNAAIYYERNTLNQNILKLNTKNYALENQIDSLNAILKIKL